MNESMVFTCLSINSPCAVTGESGAPFFNPAMQALLDSRLVIELFLAQEEKARKSRQYFSVQNIQPYGKEKMLQPYQFDFYPQFDCVYDDPDAEFECIATVCYAHPFLFCSPLECVVGEAPRPVTSEPDTRFTPREQQILFFTLNGLSAKDTGRRMNISYRTVATKLQDIYSKTGTHYTRELATYCRGNGTDRYIPLSLLSPASHILSNGGAV